MNTLTLSDDFYSILKELLISFIYQELNNASKCYAMDFDIIKFDVTAVISIKIIRLLKLLFNNTLYLRSFH